MLRTCYANSVNLYAKSSACLASCENLVFNNLLAPLLDSSLPSWQNSLFPCNPPWQLEQQRYKTPPRIKKSVENAIRIKEAIGVPPTHILPEKRKVLVLFLQDHDDILCGSITQVGARMMRFELYPHKIAVYATRDNLVQYKHLIREPTAEEKQAFEYIQIVAKLSSEVVEFKRDGQPMEGQPDTMVGSVTPLEIVDAVAEQLRIELHPSLLLMDDSITEFGEFEIPLNLILVSDGQQLTLRVKVSETKKPGKK